MASPYDIYTKLVKDADVARTPKLVADIQKEKGERQNVAAALVKSSKDLDEKLRKQDASGQVKQARSEACRAQVKADQGLACAVKTAQAVSKLQSKEDTDNRMRMMESHCLGYIASDRGELDLDSDNEDITAAELNAGAATTVTRDFVARLVTDTGDGVTEVLVLHTWPSFEMASGITPAEVVADADVGAPTVTWTTDPAKTPKWELGLLKLTVEFDTDAGATKTYAPGDSVTVTIDVSGVTALAAVPSIVKTYNVT